MIGAAWRERRIAAMQSALFEIEMERQQDAVDREWEEISPASRQVLVLFGTTDASTAANLLLRYGAAARREYASSFRLLRDLQGPRFNRSRGGLPEVRSDSSQDSSPVERQPENIEIAPAARHHRLAAVTPFVAGNRRRAAATNNRLSPHPELEFSNLRNEPNETTNREHAPLFLRAGSAA